MNKYEMDSYFHIKMVMHYFAYFEDLMEQNNIMVMCDTQIKIEKLNAGSIWRILTQF